MIARTPDKGAWRRVLVHLRRFARSWGRDRETEAVERPLTGDLDVRKGEGRLEIAPETAPRRELIERLAGIARPLGPTMAAPNRSGRTDATGTGDDDRTGAPFRSLRSLHGAPVRRPVQMTSMRCRTTMPPSPRRWLEGVPTLDYRRRRPLTTHLDRIVSSTPLGSPLQAASGPVAGGNHRLESLVTFPGIRRRPAQRRPGLSPRRHAPSGSNANTRVDAQRRPGLSPRRHTAEFADRHRATAPLNEGRGSRPGDTRRRARTPTRGSTLNEGRGSRPGDTSSRSIRPSLHRTAQRRPGLSPRRHSISSNSLAKASLSRSTKAGALAPATPRLTLVFAGVRLAQRRPGLSPRRHSNSKQQLP